MAHPKDKRERFLKGKRKGNSRAKDFWNELSEDNRTTMSRVHRNTTKVCSCFMCGNPRKFFNEKTIQEKRFDDAS